VKETWECPSNSVMYRSSRLCQKDRRGAVAQVVKPDRRECRDTALGTRAGNANPSLRVGIIHAHACPGFVAGYNTPGAGLLCRARIHRREGTFVGPLNGRTTLVWILRQIICRMGSHLSGS